LTYSTFELEQATLARTEVPAGESLNVEAVVANTGDVPGEEVLQLYIRDCQASVTRPVLELKSFVRVSADPGDRRAIRFQLPTGQLGFYGRDMAYTVEPGSIEVHLGFSSDALVHVGTFTIVDHGDGGEVRKQYTGAVDVSAVSDTTASPSVGDG
jgi:beta-glucosidase